MATGKVNVGGNGASKLNIFTQLTEPVTKEGIWLQTNNKYKKIICDSIFYFENQWDTQTVYDNIPINFVNGGKCVNLGNFIYLFQSTIAYKYDTISDKYTMLTYIPYGFNNGHVLAHGTDIYLIGGSGTSYTNFLYKYDTILNVYTQLTNIPYDFSHGGAVIKDSEIYMFASGYSSYASYTYRYSITDNNYTKLKNMPIALNSEIGCDIVGNNVYIFHSSNSYHYIYDILNNTYTTSTIVTPYGFNAGLCLSIGSYIYLLGCSNNTYYRVFYKYDTINKTFTKLTDSIFDGYKFDGAFVSNKIFCFGGASTANKVNVYSFIDKPFEENAIVLFRNNELTGTYYTELVTAKTGIEGLFPRVLSGFNNIWLFLNAKLQEYPCYYGNGTTWVKFKN